MFAETLMKNDSTVSSRGLLAFIDEREKMCQRDNKNHS